MAELKLFRSIEETHGESLPTSTRDDFMVLASQGAIRRYQESRDNAATINLRTALTYGEYDKVTSHCIYTVECPRVTTKQGHELSHAFRLIDLRKMVDSLSLPMGISKTHDYRVVDVGGQPTHWAFQKYSSAVLMPKLGNADMHRAVELNNACKSNPALEHYRDHFVYTCTLGNVTVTAEKLLFLHSIYDIPTGELIAGVVKTKADQGIYTMYWHPAMDTAKEGTLTDGIMWKRSKKKIYFNFPDGEAGYCHDYKRLRHYATTSIIRAHGIELSVSTVSYLNDIITRKFVLGTNKPQIHVVTFGFAGKLRIVCPMMIENRHNSSWFSKPTWDETMSLIKIDLNKDEANKLLDSSGNFPDASFTLRHLETWVKSFQNRIFVAGTVITNDVGDERVSNIAVSLYLYLYQNRYVNSQTIKICTDVIDLDREMKSECKASRKLRSFARKCKNFLGLTSTLDNWYQASNMMKDVQKELIKDPDSDEDDFHGTLTMAAADAYITHTEGSLYLQPIKGAAPKPKHTHAIFEDTVYDPPRDGLCWFYILYFLIKKVTGSREQVLQWRQEVGRSIGNDLMASDVVDESTWCDDSIHSQICSLYGLSVKAIHGNDTHDLPYIKIQNSHALYIVPTRLGATCISLNKEQKLMSHAGTGISYDSMRNSLETSPDFKAAVAYAIDQRKTISDKSVEYNEIIQVCSRFRFLPRTGIAFENEAGKGDWHRCLQQLGYEVISHNPRGTVEGTATTDFRNDGIEQCNLYVDNATQHSVDSLMPTDEFVYERILASIARTKATSSCIVRVKVENNSNFTSFVNSVASNYAGCFLFKPPVSNFLTTEAFLVCYGKIGGIIAPERQIWRDVAMIAYHFHLLRTHFMSDLYQQFTDAAPIRRTDAANAYLAGHPLGDYASGDCEIFKAMPCSTAIFRVNVTSVQVAGGDAVTTSVVDENSVTYENAGEDIGEDNVLPSVSFDGDNVLEEVSAELADGSSPIDGSMTSYHSADADDVSIADDGSMTSYHSADTDDVIGDPADVSTSDAESLHVVLRRGLTDVNDRIATARRTLAIERNAIVSRLRARQRHASRANASFGPYTYANNLNQTQRLNDSVKTLRDELSEIDNRILNTRRTLAMERNDIVTQLYGALQPSSLHVDQNSEANNRADDGEETSQGGSRSIDQNSEASDRVDDSEETSPQADVESSLITPAATYSNLGPTHEWKIVNGMVVPVSIPQNAAPVKKRWYSRLFGTQRIPEVRESRNQESSATGNYNDADMEYLRQVRDIRPEPIDAQKFEWYGYPLKTYNVSFTSPFGPGRIYGRPDDANYDWLGRVTSPVVKELKPNQNDSGIEKFLSIFTPFTHFVNLTTKERKYSDLDVVTLWGGKTKKFVRCKNFARLMGDMHTPMAEDVVETHFTYSCDERMYYGVQPSRENKFFDYYPEEDSRQWSQLETRSLSSTAGVKVIGYNYPKRTLNMKVQEQHYAVMMRLLEVTDKYRKPAAPPVEDKEEVQIEDVDHHSLTGTEGSEAAPHPYGIVTRTLHKVKAAATNAQGKVEKVANVVKNVTNWMGITSRAVPVPRASAGLDVEICGVKVQYPIATTELHVQKNCITESIAAAKISQQTLLHHGVTISQRLQVANLRSSERKKFMLAFKDTVLWSDGTSNGQFIPEGPGWWYQIIHNGISMRREMVKRVYVTKGTSTKGKVFITNMSLFFDHSTNMYMDPAKLESQVNLELICGVAGCGKTTEISNAFNLDTLLLSASQKGKGELAKGIKSNRPELRDIGKYSIQTIDSFLLNRSGYKPRRVIIDEAYMIEPGKIFCAAMTAGVSQLTLYGDAYQLENSSFDPNIGGKLQLDCLQKVYQYSDLRKTSYRMPQNFSDMVTGLYAARQKQLASQGIVLPIIDVKCAGIPWGEIRAIHTSTPNTAIPSEFTTVLSLTNAEKEEMKTAYGTDQKEINTVHKSQGISRDHVAYVRTNTKPKSMHHGESWGHHLVGLTRSKKSVHYYTTVADPVYNFLKRYETSAGGVGFLPEQKDVVFEKDHFVGPIADAALAVGLDITQSHRFTEKPDGLNNYVPIFSLFKQKTDYINDLRHAQAMALPFSDQDDTTFDSARKKEADILIPAFQGHINPNYRGNLPKSVLWDTLDPAILTHFPRAATNDCLATWMISAAARNLGAESDTDSNIEIAAIEKVKKFIGKAFISDKPMPTIGDNLSTIETWGSKQKPGTYERILNDAQQFEPSDNVYMCGLKKIAKTPFLQDELGGIRKNQVLAATNPGYNMVFGSIFTEMKDRTLLLLKDKFILNVDLSNEEFEAKMNDVLRPGETKCAPIGLDMSKYDQSQRYLHLCIEMELYRHLGMSEHDLRRYYASREHTVLRHRDLKTKFNIPFQRKSGSVDTWFGNTLVLLVMLSDVFDFDDCSMILAGGDDSLIWCNYRPKYMYELIRDTWGMEMKVETDSHYPMFCSKVLVPVNNAWKMVPHPVKVLQKLGDPNIRDYGHAEELRKSYYDLTKDYENSEVVMNLARIMEDHFHVPNGINLITSIRHAIDNKARFKALWSDKGKNLLKDPSYPVRR